MKASRCVRSAFSSSSPISAMLTTRDQAVKARASGFSFGALMAGEEAFEVHAVEAGGAGGARDVAVVARQHRLEIGLLEVRQQLFARFDERTREIDARRAGDGGRRGASRGRRIGLDPAGDRQRALDEVAQ